MSDDKKTTSTPRLSGLRANARRGRARRTGGGGVSVTRNTSSSEKAGQATLPINETSSAPELPKPVSDAIKDLIGDTSDPSTPTARVSLGSELQHMFSLHYGSGSWDKIPLTVRSSLHIAVDISTTNLLDEGINDKVRATQAAIFSLNRSLLQEETLATVNYTVEVLHKDKFK